MRPWWFCLGFGEPLSGHRRERRVCPLDDWWWFAAPESVVFKPKTRPTAPWVAAVALLWSSFGGIWLWDSSCPIVNAYGIQLSIQEKWQWGSMTNGPSATAHLVRPHISSTTRCGKYLYELTCVRFFGLAMWWFGGRPLRLETLPPGPRAYNKQ